MSSREQSTATPKVDALLTKQSRIYIQEYEIYIQEGPNILCPDIHWSGVAWKSVAFGLKYVVSSLDEGHSEGAGQKSFVQVVYGCRDRVVAKGKV